MILMGCGILPAVLPTQLSHSTSHAGRGMDGSSAVAAAADVKGAALRARSARLVAMVALRGGARGFVEPGPAKREYHREPVIFNDESAEEDSNDVKPIDAVKLLVDLHSSYSNDDNVGPEELEREAENMRLRQKLPDYDFEVLFRVDTLFVRVCLCVCACGCEGESNVRVSVHACGRVCARV